MNYEYLAMTFHLELVQPRVKETVGFYITSQTLGADQRRDISSLFSTGGMLYTYHVIKQSVANMLLDIQNHITETFMLMTMQESI